MSPSSKQSPLQQNDNQHRCQPIIFLDIDGVLNTTKHNTQIHFEPYLLKRLKDIVDKTNAFIVLTTFWRHFHEYISYVLHRHKIDVAKCMLPLPMGTTVGKQSTKKFLHHHRIKQIENGFCSEDGEVENASMIGRSAEDKSEYSSRAEEIEAWLKTYGEKYMGCVEDDQGVEGVTKSQAGESSTGYDFHSKDWKYVILDDRPSAAKPNTPLFDRFVLTDTKMGITEEDAEKAINLLLFGP